MEKIYINLSEPLAGKRSGKTAFMLIGYLLILVSLIGIVLGVINSDYGYSFFTMIGYLIMGLAYLFQSRKSYKGNNNYVDMDDERIEFKLGITLKKKEILWQKVSKVTINLTSVIIDFPGGTESIKTDWMLYKDVKMFKSALRNICSEKGIVLNEN